VCSGGADQIARFTLLYRGFSQKAAVLYVLVMENDSLARNTVLNMVEACGYHGIGYANASSALAAMTGVSFDSLVTGVTTSDSSIPSFVIEAKKCQPSLRIVLGAEFADKIVPRRLADALLKAPFSLDELRTAIVTALHSPPLRKRVGDL